jgi:hypothetical protein
LVSSVVGTLGHFDAMLPLMQGWGIYDQHNNFLYGGNDWIDIEAEYERRVAEDPRRGGRNGCGPWSVGSDSGRPPPP